MKWLENLSMKTKVILLVLSVIIVALSIIAVSGTIFMHYWITDEQHQDVNAIAQNLAQSCELALAVQDVDELQRLADGYMWDPFVLFIAI